MFCNYINELKNLGLQVAKDAKYRSDRMPLVMINGIDEQGTFP